MISTTHKIADYSSSPFMIHSNKVSIAPSSLSAWKAFQAGMQMLQRYASRSPVDIHAVTKSNLQLLHQSLSYDAQYSNDIENTLQEGRKNGRPTLRRLYADQGLTADLLALQDGATINLTTLPQCYAMYLLISGSAKLDTENETQRPVRHWWNRISSNGDENSLRNGSVIIRSYKQKNSQLIASGKNCLLLRIHAPTMEIPGKAAS